MFIAYAVLVGVFVVLTVGVCISAVIEIKEYTERMGK